MDQLYQPQEDITYSGSDPSTDSDAGLSPKRDLKKPDISSVLDGIDSLVEKGDLAKQFKQDGGQ
jgi:hypothetical protein